MNKSIIQYHKANSIQYYQSDKKIQQLNSKLSSKIL